MTMQALTSAAAFLFVLLAGCASRAPSGSVESDEHPRIIVASPRVADPTVQWLNVDGLDGSVLLMAVVRPPGNGPFPAVIILHGTHGFAREYIQLARDIAGHRIVTVAACWFSGRRGAGVRFITPIECPSAPALPDESELNRFRVARASVAALVRAVKRVPGVQPDRIVLFGHSRGGGAALNYALTDTGTVAGLILNSTGYPPEVTARASAIRVPILILHGTAYSPGDGGSPISAIENARSFEIALRRLQKDVEVQYYEGGTHNGIFEDRHQYVDEVRRIAAFILANGTR